MSSLSEIASTEFCNHKSLSNTITRVRSYLLCRELSLYLGGIIAAQMVLQFDCFGVSSFTTYKKQRIFLLGTIQSCHAVILPPWLVFSGQAIAFKQCDKLRLLRSSEGQCIISLSERFLTSLSIFYHEVSIERPLDYFNEVFINSHLYQLVTIKSQNQLANLQIYFTSLDRIKRKYIF